MSPCCLGKEGIEEVVDLGLNKEEGDRLKNSANLIGQLIKGLPL